MGSEMCIRDSLERELERYAWLVSVVAASVVGPCRRARTHILSTGGSFLLLECAFAGVCVCWSELLLAWLANAAAGVAGGASAGGLHGVNPFATGPELITWVLGCTFSTILLCVQHSGAQFLDVDSGRRIELCKLWWLGFAYGVPFGLPHAFLPSINPSRASPARWSKIPSACGGSACVG